MKVIKILGVACLAGLMSFSTLAETQPSSSSSGGAGILPMLSGSSGAKAPDASESTSAETKPTDAKLATASAAPAPTAAFVPSPAAKSFQAPVPAATPVPKAKTPNIVPIPPQVNARNYLLIDADSGYIITQKNADVPAPPASLTKLMTMYVVSGVIKSGRVKLTDLVMTSENAWRTGGSRMFIQVGTQVPVSDLVNGIVVASGNDASIALAEHIAGTEGSFVDLMNKTAAQLGMQKTHYADATGLPDPQNYTSPFDLAILSRAIIQNYPNDYKWYSQKWMFYNNIKQPNRNLLLWRDPSVDGLKTGFTDDAGYCLVASAKRGNMRLIAVVMGSPSTKQRANDIEALFNYGFRFFQTRKLYAQNTQVVNQRTWYGKDKNTPLGLAQDLYVTLPVGQDIKQVNTVANVAKPFSAPIIKGQGYGQMDVVLNNQVISSQPLVALQNNPQAWMLSRLFDHVSLLFQRWFHSA